MTAWPPPHPRASSLLLRPSLLFIAAVLQPPGVTGTSGFVPFTAESYPELFLRGSGAGGRPPEARRPPNRVRGRQGGRGWGTSVLPGNFQYTRRAGQQTKCGVQHAPGGGGAHTHTHTGTQIHTQRHTHSHAHRHTFRDTHSHIHTGTQTHTDTRTGTHIHAQPNGYTLTETDTHTHALTD